MIQDVKQSSVTVLQGVIQQLQSPIADLHTLLGLLCLPLDKAGLLSPQYSELNSLSVHGTTTPHAIKFFPLIQRILLESVLPTWEGVLEEEKYSPLATQYFCPDAFLNASPSAGDVALYAYSTILSLRLHQRCITLLVKLAKEYPIDRLFKAVVSIPDQARRSVAWDDCLRNIFAVPSKVANALAGRAIPPELEVANYFNNLSIRFECLLHDLSNAAVADDVSLLTHVLSKLVNVGAFPASRHLPLSQPFFFRYMLPSIRNRLRRNDAQQYQKLWTRTISSLPSVHTQQTVIASLLTALVLPESPLGTSAHDRGIVHREATLLRDVIGDLDPDDDVWDSVVAVVLTRTWSQNHARVFVCWMADRKQNSSQGTLEVFLSRVIDVWSSPEHIKHSLLSHHQYISVLFLLAVTYFPLASKEVKSVALSPAVISAVGHYISHLDNSVRRCGMLVAEIVAGRAGKNLNFGDWEGDEDGRLWARSARQLCIQRDVDFDPCCDDNSDREEPAQTVDIEETTETSALQEVVSTIGMHAQTSSVVEVEAEYDSDDSLTGYASPSSSRSASPAPHELEDIAKDPTLHVGVKRIPRPVYLAQLGELVRGSSGLKSSEETQDADRIEMALAVGEELIRRRRDYGTELGENAANLIYGFIALNNNFDLDDFDKRRQCIMNALVACCPRITAQCVIEQFFKNQYSTEQRYVMLNALALGARELASLPVYSSSLKPLNDARMAFPSKLLPPALHQKYLAASSRDNVQLLLDDITRDAIDKQREATADRVPQFVRERQLRIRKPTKVTELTQKTNLSSLRLQDRSPSAPTFTEVAAEFFIVPFINRFWAFLRDEQIREERTAQRDVLYQYRGAGTGLILNPVTLAEFLRTIAVLVHAAQNAPQWLAVIAPDALELAITVGSRQLTKPMYDDSDESTPGGDKGKEAAVLTAAFELSLIILDGCLELDGGRSLGLEHAALLLGVGEWAGRVLTLLDRGTRVEGGGGAQEAKLSRAAAGVVLKVDELTSKWRRSMVDVR
ncbi:telomere length regulation protein-domain-containing protein [Phlebopus sp. FC_14]|nr:telomere length regulation protein-domain-containing protein [Phlebopus sp. FC_14]